MSNEATHRKSMLPKPINKIVNIHIYVHSFGAYENLYKQRYQNMYVDWPSANSGLKISRDNIRGAKNTLLLLNFGIILKKA